MIKNSKDSNGSKMSSKNDNKSVRMGGPGSASRKGQKGINHGVAGRQMTEEHSDRMGYTSETN